MADEDGAIEFRPQSAAIAEVRWVPLWGPTLGIMRVTFTNGKVYGHDGVPRDVVERFRDAASAGSFYNAEIKGSY